VGGRNVTITYHRTVDLLYICLDPEAKQVVNKDISDDVVLELGENDRIVGIEILDASKRIDLARVPSVQYAEVA
jgi:uncharacterized protein YuzE